MLAFARLQLEIAKAKAPMAQMDIADAFIKRTVGFRKLRAWFLGLSKAKRVQACKWMRQQIEAYAAIMAKAKAAGETDITLADVELLAKEATTGEPLADIDFRSDDQPPQEQSE